MASNITVDTLTKGSTTLNTDEIVDTSSNQICKAWVNFNGEGTVAIQDSHNVSSITDNGTGYYTVHFITSMSNDNYTVTGATLRNAKPHFSGGSGSMNTGNIITYFGQWGSSYVAQDVDTAMVQVFGN